jgi:hypothetical protein
MAGGGYRPDSVPRGAASIHLGRVSPHGSCSLPGNLTRQNGIRGQAPSIPLFGLAPHGVYHALSVSEEAVRSYRTLSPLPPVQNGGGLLSAALSLALPRPGVTRRASCRGVRTFLQGVNPSGRPPPPAAASIAPAILSQHRFSRRAAARNGVGSEWRGQNADSTQVTT